MSGLAILDEQLQWHENIGYFVQKNVLFLPRRLTHYTDDIIILAGAFVGGSLLLYCIIKSPQRIKLIPYLLAVVIIGASHGVLDLISHKYYFLKIFIPDLTYENSFSLIERMGYFEECCKLWTEWFVILFLLRFLYQQKASLLWPIQIFIGSMLITVGLWNFSGVDPGIPYLPVGTTLNVIRNYHYLLILSCVWMAWGTMTWILYKDKIIKLNRIMAGMFFLRPFFLLFPYYYAQAGLENVFGIIAQLTIPRGFYHADLISLTVFLLSMIAPGVLLGLAGGYVMKNKKSAEVFPMVLFFSMLGIVLFFLGISVHLFYFFMTGGLILPLAIVILIIKNRGPFILLLMTLLPAFLVRNPVFMLVAAIFIIIQMAQIITVDEMKKYYKEWLAFIVLHLLSLIFFIWLANPMMIQNIKYTAFSKYLLKVKFQPFHTP